MTVSLDRHRLDEHRDDRPRRQPKLPMAQHPQQRADGARMRRQRYKHTVIIGENIVEQPLHPFVDLLVGFAMVRGPELVVLGETGFEGEIWELGREGGSGAAAIAGVHAVDFAEELLDHGFV